MTFLLSVLCILIGAAAIYKPDVFWNLQHFLYVKDGEPTKFYLICTRAVGVLAICVGVAGVVLEMLG